MAGFQFNQLQRNAPMSTYEWGSGLRTSGLGVTLNKRLDPDVAGGEIERLEKKHGDTGVRESDIVDAARSPRSKLHKAFEWDDAEGAERYRIEQARMLTRSLVKQIETSPGKTEPIRAFVKTQPRNGPIKSIDVAFADPDDRTYVLQQCLGGLVAWRRKWAALNRYADVSSALEQVDKAIRNIQKVTP
jgi:hypothetical protein